MVSRDDLSPPAFPETLSPIQILEPAFAISPVPTHDVGCEGRSNDVRVVSYRAAQEEQAVDVASHSQRLWLSYLVIGAGHQIEAGCSECKVAF